MCLSGLQPLAYWSGLRLVYSGRKPRLVPNVWTTGSRHVLAGHLVGDSSLLERYTSCGDIIM